MRTFTLVTKRDYKFDRETFNCTVLFTARRSQLSGSATFISTQRHMRCPCAFFSTHYNQTVCFSTGTWWILLGPGIAHTFKVRQVFVIRVWKWPVRIGPSHISNLASLKAVRTKCPLTIHHETYDPRWLLYKCISMVSVRCWRWVGLWDYHWAGI
jgi:hypothetical protein